jgi:lipopolysaccharide/colanic/teichoic acid biosynthesis glycosyltransferase
MPTGAALDKGTEYVTIPMAREITLGRDLLSLLHLWQEFRRLRPAISDVSTPKAGMLAGVAAVMARVPIRVYRLRGLRFESARGIKRAILLAAEFVACHSAHCVIAVSESVREVAIQHGLVDPAKIIVIGKGGGNGVNPARFVPGLRDAHAATRLRESLGIPVGAPVVGFVGRFTRDKGIAELVAAYDQLSKEFPQLHLLLVGGFEDGDAVSNSLRLRIENDPQIVRPGFVPDPERFYSIMDVLALPTYREGFPGVVLEAQASGLPVVTTYATGAVDSIENGHTGLLVPIANPTALACALGTLLSDSSLRCRMGDAGRVRVLEYFRNDIIWDGILAKYRQLLQAEKQGRTLRARRAYCMAKRGFDIFAAAAGLLILSPLMLVVALLIWCTMGGPVLFRQTRPGFLAKPFSLLKFRSMRDPVDHEGRPLPDAARLTRLGSWLRRLSFDELPQLWNVLLGDMSLIGPRPLLMEYLERYTDEQARRHEVMPGITGWAQVNGRNSLSWEEKFALDTWYVEHLALAVDVKILAMTVWRVLRRDGISNGKHATMPEFLSSDEQRQKTHNCN